MKKRLLLIAGFLCLLTLVGAFFWRATLPVPPASTDRIPLPDGSWVYLEAVTHGTNHLVGPRLAMLTHKLPPKMQTLMLRVFGKHASMRFMTTTPTPQLVLWLNRGPYANKFPANSGYMRCVITDMNGFAAGEESRYDAPYPLEAKPFTLFPRRDPEFVLKIYHHDLVGRVKECGQMRIANPLYGHYPQWKPGALPMVKRDGELEATLHRVLVSVDKDASARRQRDGSWQLTIAPARPDTTPINLGQLELRSTTDSNIHWQVASVGVQDATGNHCECGNLALGGLGKDWFSFSPGLWTNESAWKLLLGVKRTTGFKPDELLKFENVPLGELNQSNRLAWTTNAQGVTITLTSLVRRAPALENLLVRSNLSVVEFEIAGLRNGQPVDLIEAVTDDGTKLKAARQDLWQKGPDSGRRYQFGTIPREAHTVNFTFAVQTNRTLEFLVKPELVTKPVQFKVEPK